jgi:hypothetical protein
VRVALGDDAREPRQVGLALGQARELAAQRVPQAGLEVARQVAGPVAQVGRIAVVEREAQEVGRADVALDQEALLAKQAQVVLDAALRHLESEAELDHRELLELEEPEDTQPRRVAQDPQRGGQRSGVGDHGPCFEQGIMIA